MFPDDQVIPFTAWHWRRALDEVAQRSGTAPLRRLPLPRPLLYEGWHRLALPPLWIGGRALRGIDVIHAPSVAVPPKGRSALVVTVHDMASVLFPDTYPRRGRHFHATGVAAAAARADLVITVSQSAAAELAQHSTISPERIRVVPNGVEPFPISPQTQAARLASLGLTDRRYVLWVGSLEPRKGVGTLVSAFAALHRRRPGGDGRQVMLVLAGFPGWLNQGLIDPADRRVLGPQLLQVGPVSETDLWSLYAGAELCAVPSRHEGFGLPVLEAMSQGTAVLCSDLPVLREVGGDAARYVPVGDPQGWADALGELLDDPSGRERLAAAGLARSREFGWERTVRATRAVYAEALEARS